MNIIFGTFGTFGTQNPKNLGAECQSAKSAIGPPPNLTSFLFFVSPVNKFVVVSTLRFLYLVHTGIEKLFYYFIIYFIISVVEANEPIVNLSTLQIL